MKKNNVIITLVVFLVAIVLVVLADGLKMDYLQFWKGGLLLASLALTCMNAIRNGTSLITKDELLHVLSGFMLGASVVLFIGMCLNIV